MRREAGGKWGGEKARRQAVARVLAGEPAEQVDADLGRSDRWVRKWVTRYDPAEGRRSLPGPAASGPTGPPRGGAGGAGDPPPADGRPLGAGAGGGHRLGDGKARPGAARGMDHRPHPAQSRGPQAPGSPPLRPKGRTRGSLARPSQRLSGDRPGGSPSPGGGGAFSVLNAVDLDRRRAGIEILRSKEEPEVAGGLLGLWRRLGLPKVAKFDNGQTIRGRGRHLALAVRTCLALGVRVRSFPSPSRGATQRWSTSTTCQALLPHRSLPGPGPPGQSSPGLRGLPQHPPPLLGAQRGPPPRSGRPGCASDPGSPIRRPWWQPSCLGAARWSSSG